MGFKYFPHTEADQQAMLERVGADSADALFADVPESVRFRGDYDIAPAMSELEVRRHLQGLGLMNEQLTCFAGAGIYDHYTPAIVPNLVGRSEFLTSYTPYQAEISQGTLHYIFEYQSMMAELTGMDISNASMYDGATATAEAAMMAIAAGKKCTRVLLSDTVDPRIRRVVETYARFQGFDVVGVKADGGITDRASMEQLLGEGGVAGVVVQQPNYFGIVEDYTGFADAAHQAKALFIVNAVPADLAILKTPGEWGADIAVGDGQSLGIPMSFGGPSLGYMCCTEKLIRKMPGRIVGKTRDNRGQRAFVLTLQAREQHIRRQKATSNICSNQSLMALWATIYMAVMGKEGLKEAAAQSYAGAHYLAGQIGAIPGTRFSLPYGHRPFFNEFCVECREPVDQLMQRCTSHGILPGVKVDEHRLLMAVTEKRTKEEIDTLVNILKTAEE